MIEVERKFRLTPDRAAALKLQLDTEYGAATPMHQIDQIFLQGINSFKEFTKGSPVMRLRTTDDSTLLTFKRDINGAGDSLEHELEISDAKIMQQILEQMDWRQVTLVDKVRTEYKADDITIELDSVASLGDFLEIEILQEGDDATGAEKRILDMAGRLGLSAQDIEPRKYDVMMSQLNEH